MSHFLRKSACFVENAANPTVLKNNRAESLNNLRNSHIIRSYSWPKGAMTWERVIYPVSVVLDYST
jgi:hypothetical protein